VGTIAEWREDAMGWNPATTQVTAQVASRIMFLAYFRSAVTEFGLAATSSEEANVSLHFLSRLPVGERVPGRILDIALSSSRFRVAVRCRPRQPEEISVMFRKRR
jgi:hypothetical protein